MSKPAVPRRGELDREQRLLEIRRQAELGSKPTDDGIHALGGPLPRASVETGYYGIPLLKEPSWTWEIPLYFFVGGTAAAAGVIGSIASYTGADPRLVRHARFIAAAGSVLSPPLLIADLGRPMRFLNMLRVFKPQSAMSVGAWTLVGFSAGSSAALFAELLAERYGKRLPIRLLDGAGRLVSLLFGLPFSNYTGVLIGATTIPAWNENAGELPLHFGMSGLASAVGLLELMGHERSRALQVLGLTAALVECWQGLRIEISRQPSLDPLKHGGSGWLTRTGGVFSGPLPLALRLAGLLPGVERGPSLRKAASLFSIAGSLLARIAWIYAGHRSARDWKLPLAIR